MSSIEDIEAILATPGIVGVDFETTIARAYDRELCTFQVSHTDGREAVVHIHQEPLLQLRLKQALDASPCTLAAHFAVFEWECFHKLGARPKDVVCTYVAARVLHGAMVGSEDEDGEEEYGGWGLDDIAASMLGIDVDKTLQKADWREPLTPEREAYCLQDSSIARDIWFALKHEFSTDPDSWRGFQVVNDAIPVIARCNLHRGVRFNRDAHNALRIVMERQLREHEFELDVWCRGEIDNHNSGPQVSKWIAKTLFNQPDQKPHIAAMLFSQATGVHWPTTADGRLSLRKPQLAKLLETLELAWPDTIGAYIRTRLSYMREAKLLQAFGEKLAALVDVDGAIRGSGIPHGARTSRMSMRDPNLQQMPNDDPDAGIEFRRIFEAFAGRKLVICDYGQIELRVGCIIADDKRMQLIFQEGFDIHAATAVAVFALGAYDKDNPAHRLLRKKAKAPNFAALYGAEAPTIALNAGMPVAEARDLLDKWLEEYSGIAKYRREQPEVARMMGCVQLVSGQKIAVLDTTRPAQMINAPVQGGSASVLYRAAVRVSRRLEEERLDAVLFLLVHDELIVDAAEEDAVPAARVLQEEMTAALLEFFPQAVDLGVDDVADASICDHWGQKDDANCKLENYIERMAA